EVSVPGIRLAGKGAINPPVALFMTARARVIRTADGAELYAETFEYGGGSTYKFLEWAAEGGRAFRQEMDRGTRSLADDIAQLLFPGSARDSTPAAQSVEPVGTATASAEPLAASTPAAEAPATPTPAPAKEAELAPQPLAAITAAPVDLRTWLPGVWDTSAGAT